MKILLKENVEKLGEAGDIVNVADGYARNYLIPQGLAVKASAGQLKQVDLFRRQAQLKRERIDAQIAALAEKLSGIQLSFEAKASERGRLYGSITKDDVVEILETKLGEPVDRRKVEMDPLRQIGFHSIPVRLSGEVIPEISVIVHREGEDPADYIPVPEEPAVEDGAEVESTDLVVTPAEDEAEVESTDLDTPAEDEAEAESTDLDTPAEPETELEDQADEE